MALSLPIILYNGLLLGFVASAYSTAWGRALGSSSVGFGASVFYTANAIATPLMGRLATRQDVRAVGVFILAGVLNVIAFLMSATIGLDSVRCTEDKCAEPLPCASQSPIAGKILCADCTFRASLCVSIRSRQPSG